MRKTLRKLLTRVASRLTYLGRLIYTDPMEERVKPWFALDENNGAWIYHDLNENSIVFDVGGYQGRFASDMFAMYRCRQIYVFEPVREYADRLRKRFARNRSIVVCDYGLWKENTRARIAVCADGSSLFLSGSNMEEVSLVRADEFIGRHGIQRIDMMKINIEGAEYDLLEHLIETGFIKNIKNIQVQFHDFVEDAEKRMIKIQKKLQKTHYLTYQYPFVWENWEIKQKINKK